MTESATLVPPELLAPIPGPDPAGVSLRYETIYQNIAEARREEDANLPQGNWKRPLKLADWNVVSQMCSEVLVRQSKDLQIAAWLAEAWLHLEGLEGLTRGLQLVKSLCIEYWEGIHPRVEDDEIEYRLAPFEWINENLSLAMRLEIPLSEGTSDQIETGLTLANWDEVLRAENLVRKNAELAKSSGVTSKITRSAFMATVSLTPPTFFRSLLDQLAACSAAATELERLMQEKLGNESPGMGRVQEVIGAITKTVREFAGQPGSSEAAKGAEPARAPRAGKGAPQGGAKMKEQPMAESGAAEKEMPDNRPPAEMGPSYASPIRSREEAYRRLSDAADYLLRVEPHSPTPYLVMRAVTWGNMPLTQLLEELVQNKGDLQQLYMLLGMRSDP